MLDPAGALFWPATGLLAVSDLHLEKGSSYARRGQLLPPWDTHATLDRLTAAAAPLAAPHGRRARRSVSRCGRSARLPHGEIARLSTMTEAHRFIWVQGNHDPTPPQRHRRRMGARVRHHHADLPPSGVARAQTARSAATTIRRRRSPRAAAASAAPASSPTPAACMMPAFGAYTGGLDVRDPAIARLFPRGGRVFLLGKERLFSFALATCAPMTSVRPPHGRPISSARCTHPRGRRRARRRRPRSPTPPPPTASSCSSAT